MISRVLKLGRLLFKAQNVVRVPTYYFDDKNYTNWSPTSANLPVDIDKRDYDTLEVNEVKTRVMRVLSHFEKINLKDIKWEADI